MKKFILIILSILTIVSCQKEQSIEQSIKQNEEPIELNSIFERLSKIEEKINNDIVTVDGLRFDGNGNIVSTAKIENEITEYKGANWGTFTSKRILDENGRLIEVDSKYSDGIFGGQSTPYLHKHITFVYEGKRVIKTTKTLTFGNLNYETEETITEYW